MKTPIIGFTKKYYTLWLKWEETVNLTNNRYITRTHYTFKQNLSFNFDIACDKAGTTNFDPDLRSTKSWSRDSKPKLHTDFDIKEYVVSFGKYKGATIDEILKKDIKYLIWLSDSIWDEQIAKEIKIMDEVQEYFKNEERLREEKWESIKELTPNKTHIIEINPKRNLKVIDDEAYLIHEYENTTGLKFSLFFGQFKKEYYQGVEYGLPIFEGRAKRIKNKKLRLIVIAKEAISSHNKWEVFKNQELEVVYWEMVKEPKETKNKVENENVNENVNE